MGALAGFILGYYLGAKQGPNGYAELRQALDTILASPEARAVLDFLPFRIPTGNGAAERMDPDPDGRPTDQLGNLLRQIADSDAVQSLLSGGLDLAHDLLDRFAPPARD